MGLVCHTESFYNPPWSIKCDRCYRAIHGAYREHVIRLAGIYGWKEVQTRCFDQIYTSPHLISKYAFEWLCPEDLEKAMPYILERQALAKQGSGHKRGGGLS